MGATQSTNQSYPPCEGGKEAVRKGETSSSCPVGPEARPVYNVYNQRVDGGVPSTATAGSVNPSNNMPASANQLPVPGQRQPLSTTREVSTIPKGGTDATWVYPSPQMFYNALHRKGKSDGVDNDKEMDSVMGHVVSTHNRMNEMTWDQVMRWERLHPESCSNAQLNRFLGRPHDLSPLARLRTMLGYTPPFDRHDWYVLRREGTEVRYVIDFYFDEAFAGRPEAFEIVARPALDNFECALDRAKMAVYVQCARWGVPCPITGDAGRIAQHAQQGQPQTDS